MVLETRYQALLAAVTALHTTRMLAHVPQHLESLQAMTQVESENFQEPSTMATHTPVIPVKIGAQEPTGLVSLGRMHKETFQETRLHKTITSGTRTRPRSQSQFLTKGQRTVTQHNRLTIRPPSKKPTTTVSTPALFLSVCMGKPMAAQQAYNHTSKILHSVQTVCKAQPLETALVTPFVQPMLAAKFTSSHRAVAVQARCLSLLKQWFTFQPTTLVKSTCPFLTRMAR